MRRTISAILIVLGCVSAPLALVGFWATEEIGNTDRYVETVAPLAGDQAVQNAVTERITAAIVWPLRKLDPSVSDAPVRGAVDAVVGGEDFPAVWARVNRVAHRQVSAILSGEGGPLLLARGGTVALDLAPVYEPARRGLVDAGLPIAARLPDLHPMVELFSSAELERAQTVYAWLTRLKRVLPVLSVVLLAAGVLLAGNREIALIGAGLGLAAGMAVLAVALAVARDVYLPTLDGGGVQADALTAIFHALTGFLRGGLRLIFAAGLILAGTVFLLRRRRASRPGPTGTGPAARTRT